MTKSSECEIMKMLMAARGLDVNTNNVSLRACAGDNSTVTFPYTEETIDGHYVTDNGAAVGLAFYAYVTPIILIVGLIGNSISLKVFLSRNLSRLSASLYLAALSASDTLVLMTYVLLGWLDKGLPYWPGNKKVNVIDHEGACHLFVFFSYTFRFVSVWLIVVFTIERYIAVCRPLQRRIICTKTFARRMIIGVTLAGAVVSLFKPILTGLYAPGKEIANMQQAANGHHELPVNGVSSVTYDADDFLSDFGNINRDFVPQETCTRNPKYHHFIFVMDVLYGLIITAVPFLVITVFNMIIMRKLVNRDTFRGQVKLRFKENRVRLEFTITLLAVSSCFICLNFPYFVVFCQQFVQSIDPGEEDLGEDPVVMRHRNNMYITKTIFNINYSINFFLYCMTGTYYRGAIKSMLTCSNKDPFSPVPLRKASTSTSLQTQMKELSYTCTDHSPPKVRMLESYVAKPTLVRTICDENGLDS